MKHPPICSRRWFLTAATALALGSRAQDAPPRLKVGQIGTGHSHAAGKMAAVRALPEHFEVVGIAEPDATRRRAAQNTHAYAGLPWMTEEELLAQPEVTVVLVETDLPELTATAQRVIKAGKHLHLDKPGTQGARDHTAFAALRREAEARGLIVQMGYMLRHQPIFELLRHAVHQGWLGEIIGVDAAMGKQADDAGRAMIGQYAGGGLFELGCHLVDLTLSLLGPPQRVHGFSTPSRDDGIKDNQLAVLEYPRATAVLRCHHADPFGMPRRFFSVTGTQGTFHIAPLESGRAELHLQHPAGEWPAGTHALHHPAPHGRYGGEFLALAAAIRQRQPLPWNADHDIAVHETVLRASGSRME